MKPWMAGVVVGVLALAGGGWLWYSRTPEQKDPGYKYMHCPDCDLEVPYDAKKVNRPCPACGPKGPTLIPTRKRMTEGGTGESELSPAQKMVASLVIALVVLQGGIYFWVIYSRAAHRAAQEAQAKPLKCHCPLCKRKLAYPAKKAGAEAICPRCKRPFLLPDKGSED